VDPRTKVWVESSVGVQSLEVQSLGPNRLALALDRMPTHVGAPRTVYTRPWAVPEWPS
jgi:hypothetical protein